MSTIHDIGDAFYIVDFKASLPAGPGQTFAKIIFIHPVILLHDDRQGHGSYCCIHSLMSSYERNKEKTLFKFLRHIFPFHRNYLSMFPGISGINFKIPAVEIDAGFFFMGFLLQLFQSHMLGCSNHRNAFFDDASLLVSDFLKGIAQVLHVVHSHIGNDRNHRKNDIGRIIKSAHAHFHNCVIHFLFFEIPESHGRQKFKFRRCFYAVCNDFFRRLPHHGSCFGKVFSGNIMAADINPFGVVQQMRGNVTPHPELGIFQHAGNHGHHASFAVGAGDMNHLVSGFRISQFLQHGFYPFQSRLNAKGRCLFQIGH